ncbi:MAG: hypothetical protein JWM69_1511, partial [Candidatus Binatus sp.]|nr:hypothetical protein [Candidatus Binatus sp.]
FNKILALMNLQARDILFVGDTAQDDVWGAKRAGMQVAWISPRGLPLPEGIPAPDLTIADLAELPAVLGISDR